MHASVVDSFVAFTQPLEGKVLWPYLDVLGLVTVGYGCLIDPLPLAERISWKLPNGLPASLEAVRADWTRLKARKDLAKVHFKFAAAVTSIRLTEEGAGDLLRLRAASFEVELKKHLPSWDSFPADAQLCCMSMAWACGPGFPITFKNFAKFANLHDWANAAKCAAIRTEGNPGIVPRNAQNSLCMVNAAASAARGLPVDQLFWPQTVPLSGAPTVTAPASDDALRMLALQALALHPIDTLGQAGRDIAEHDTLRGDPNDNDPANA